MIPSFAIKSYLRRPLNSHRWVKQLAEKTVDKALSELDPKPQLNKRMRLHQKACFLLGVSFPKFCFWLDMGCVDGDTEYLTPTGWKPIRDYKSGVVAQYDPHTRRSTFVQPLSFVNRACSEMWHFKTSRGLDQMLSMEHNMLVVGNWAAPEGKGRRSAWKHTPVAPAPEYASKAYPNPWFYKVSAEEMAELAGQRHVSIETTFEMDGTGIDLTDEQIRVQVAVHADGTLPNNTSAYIRIKKQRKKERLRLLLDQAGISYQEKAIADDFSMFKFKAPLHTKFYDYRWWKCSLAQKRVIASEVEFWDGSSMKASGSAFFSRSKGCAEFIQFCFSSTRRRAFIKAHHRLDGSIDYVVHAIGSGRTTNLTNLLGGKHVHPADGRKYCFEVPTGYLVLRRNGNVFVTGNTGKTLLSLELLRYWMQAGSIERALIFVTSDKAFHTWEKQLKEFKIDVPLVSLVGSSAEKWQQLESLQRGFALVAYPGAVAMVCDRSKKEGKLSLNKGKAKKLTYWADAFVLDESTKAGNQRSLTFKMINALRKQAKIRYALAGRPFGRDPTMLWSQCFLIDDGKTLGETLGLFRAAFFDEKDNPWDPKGYAKDYTFKQKMRPELANMVQHCSITYSAEECVGLPKVIPVVDMVPFPQEAQAYYERAIADLIAAKGNFRELKSAFLRMRQISSGFIGLKDDESGERAEIELMENPKLDRLFELIEEMPEGRKAVCFYDYTYTGKKIVEGLKERDIGSIWMWAGTKDPTKQQQRFEKDPNCTVAVINSKVGAMSLDGLQYVANYLFFPESPISVIDREQAERRLIRQGQERTVFMYDICMKSTVDVRILELHKEGKDIFEAVVKNPGLLR